MSARLRLACLFTLPLAACTVTGTISSDPGDADAEEEAETLADNEQAGKADLPGWGSASTIHVGDSAFDFVEAGDRHVHALWASASESEPMSLEVTVEAAEETGTVRVAVLGPLRDGERTVVASDGYSEPSRQIDLAVRLTESGQHLVVIGSWQLATESAYRAAVRCAAGSTCDPERIDVLAVPKTGALVGADDLIAARLGRVLDDRDFDVEMEVWSAPPAQTWNAELVGVSVASGDQVNALVPDSVAPGDDIILVLREAGGSVLDTGVLGRFAPDDAVFARLDSILYGDLVAVTVSGVTGYFEGVAELALRSVDHDREIERAVVRAERPGQVGNGLAAFDATFAPWIADDNGDLNPVLPKNGELLSVGRINGNGDFLPFGCFQYCNDLSGEDACTGGRRSCN